MTYYQWRVLEQDRRGRDKWRILRWRMTEAGAADWAASTGRTIEKVPGSGEERTGAGTYVLRPSGGAMRTPGFGPRRAAALTYGFRSRGSASISSVSMIVQNAHGL
jgi:hypothetical protein